VGLHSWKKFLHPLVLRLWQALNRPSQASSSGFSRRYDARTLPYRRLDAQAGSPCGGVAAWKDHRRDAQAWHPGSCLRGSLTGALLVSFPRNNCRRRAAGDRSRHGPSRSTGPGDPP
jgi:hypothetical protein